MVLLHIAERKAGGIVVKHDPCHAAGVLGTGPACACSVTPDQTSCMYSPVRSEIQNHAIAQALLQRRLQLMFNSRVDELNNMMKTKRVWTRAQEAGYPLQEPD